MATLTLESVDLEAERLLAVAQYCAAVRAVRLANYDLGTGSASTRTARSCTIAKGFGAVGGGRPVKGRRRPSCLRRRWRKLQVCGRR